MIEKPMDVLEKFPVRKSKKQKQAFRDEIQSYVRSLGYESAVEKGSMGANNLVIGNPETAQYLVTAHYDTPAGMLLPNLITPCNPFTFILYQLVIVGLFLAVSIGIGVGSSLLLDNVQLGTQIALIVYWAMLICMMVGPANKSNANDNTSGVVSVLEIAKSMPQSSRSKVCFILFDLEEAGLVGSSSYRKKHKAQTENQIVLNMDCVGDGNELLMFPSKKLKKDEAKMEKLRSVCGIWGTKSIAVREKGFSYYPSDQKNFPLGVGIAAFRRVKWVGLYCARIHTRKDTILEATNVNILRAAVVTLISGNAVN